MRNHIYVWRKICLCLLTMNWFSPRPNMFLGNARWRGAFSTWHIFNHIYSILLAIQHDANRDPCWEADAQCHSKEIETSSSELTKRLRGGFDRFCIYMSIVRCVWCVFMAYVSGKMGVSHWVKKNEATEYWLLTCFIIHHNML